MQNDLLMFNPQTLLLFGEPDQMAYGNRDEHMALVVASY